MLNWRRADGMRCFHGPMTVDAEGCFCIYKTLSCRRKGVNYRYSYSSEPPLTLVDSFHTLSPMYVAGLVDV
jgi:hypothetical protein